MNSALDYLDWRGDLDFNVSPVNEVDVFLCSQVVTPDYRGIVSEDNIPLPISQVEREYFSTHDDSLSTLGVLQSQSVHPMLHKLSCVDRYRNIMLTRYYSRVILENDEQCSAVTVLFPSGNICISFQGTDDTIIGWKEDFNIAVMDSVPAQRDALDYVKRVASDYPDAEITVCGHSKGGNLAVYAAVMAPPEIRSRISRVFNFDGPGFPAEFLQTKPYAEMLDRITTVVSNNSFVGLLLNRVGTVRIVRANVAGPMAHDGFNWEVRGTGFVTEEKLSEVSATFEKAMAETLDGMTTGQRREFIDELFDTLLSTGAVTCSELTDLDPVAVAGLFKDFGKDDKVRNFARTLIEKWMKVYYENSRISEIEKKISKTAETIRDAGKEISIHSILHKQ